MLGSNLDLVHMSQIKSNQIKSIYFIPKYIFTTCYDEGSPCPSLSLPGASASLPSVWSGFHAIADWSNLMAYCIHNQALRSCGHLD